MIINEYGRTELPKHNCNRIIQLKYNNICLKYIIIYILLQSMNEHKLDLEKGNKLRTTEINTYYGEEYKAYIDLLKIIFLFCMLFLVLTIVKNINIIPEMILNIVMGIVIVSGIGYTLWILYDISLRDKMNFSEYNWVFSKPKNIEPPPPPFENNDDMDNKNFGLGCFGVECCSDGMSYNEVLNKCVNPIK